MNTEEEINKMKIEQALLKKSLEDHLIAGDIFHEQVLEKLDYLQARDIKVFQFIEARMKKEETSAALRQAILSKLLTSGVWAAAVLLGYILWNSFISYIQKGGN